MYVRERVRTRVGGTTEKFLAKFCGDGRENTELRNDLIQSVEDEKNTFVFVPVLFNFLHGCFESKCCETREIGLHRNSRQATHLAISDP